MNERPNRNPQGVQANPVSTFALSVVRGKPGPTKEDKNSRSSLNYAKENLKREAKRNKKGESNSPRISDPALS
ncbi:737_t:CDS:2 [Scutellospora calospora]|uniref:737_t:CDS:1 n=1 Tax=Scutellospora calospora TaxID=85575 RepID=A0ACA9LBB8_9GLOM|nr:737_t:CDS:2 [Scutellospora calospora]